MNHLRRLSSTFNCHFSSKTKSVNFKLPTQVSLPTVQAFQSFSENPFLPNRETTLHIHRGNLFNLSVLESRTPWSLETRRYFSAEGSHQSQSTGSLVKLYEERVAKGDYRRDERQAEAIKLLQNLHDNLMQCTTKTSLSITGTETSDSSTLTSIWSRLAGSTSPTADPSSSAAVQGLYMYGGVGAGKTMIMDVFVEHAPEDYTVLRTHFHDFMLDVHMRLRQHQSEQDPLKQVAKDIIKLKGKKAGRMVLCMDEFMVTDVADAMILNRLFSRLFTRGAVLVATSNRAPDRLYEGGLQRDLFLPFIARLKKACVSYDINSKTDYRRLARKMLQPHFYVDNCTTGVTSSELLLDSFNTLCSSGPEPMPATVEVQMGRHLNIPAASGKLAKFSFEELCETAVGAADYIALCNNYHTIAIDGIPVFDSSNRPAAYRFMTLIDVMYEHRVRLLASSQGEVFMLFSRVHTVEEAKGCEHKGDYIVDDNLGFTKHRVMSRLTEMHSKEYALAHARMHAPELLKELEMTSGSMSLDGLKSTSREVSQENAQKQTMAA